MAEQRRSHRQVRYDRDGVHVVADVTTAVQVNRGDHDGTATAGSACTTSMASSTQRVTVTQTTRRRTQERES